MTRSDDPALRRWIRQEHRRSAGAFARRDVVLESYRACLTSTVNDFLGSTFGPTLVLAAGRDALNPLGTQRELTRRIRHSAFHVFPALGHLLPYEATRECAELIAAWQRFMRNPAAHANGEVVAPQRHNLANVVV